MAYPYYPSYTNPYQNYYQPMYQPVQQQPVMAQQAQQTAPVQSYSPAINQSGIIWVSGPMEAQSYPIAPNNAVALWEKSGKVIYLKSADATGKPTMTVYDLVERDQSASDSVTEQNTEYATKSDLSAVVGVVKGFDELIGSIKSDIDNMKGDLYGIAGKKKTTTKKTLEVADDE